MVALEYFTFTGANMPSRSYKLKNPEHNRTAELKNKKPEAW